MKTAKASVIVPAYNGSDYLGDAIQSVLDQTYQDFEVLVVDDCSTDSTSDIIHQFKDSRVKYVSHEENRGANVARNTGIRASLGEIIFFLDQDDLFHPEKLQTHVSFLDKHPDVGFTYNSRFELNHSSNTIRDMWQPPSSITLADLVLGFPLSPTDMVIKRNWLFEVGLWDEQRVVNGGEITLTSRLYLAGCKFASVDRSLNYRRYQSGRIFNDIYSKCQAELTCQEKIFSLPQFPDNLLYLRDTAFMNTYMIWAYYAFVQDETALGQKLILEAFRRNPSIIKGEPSEIVNFLVYNSIADESEDYEHLLHKIINQMPPELAKVSELYNWAVARGYLYKGSLGLIWNRHEEGEAFFRKAKIWGAEIDEVFIHDLTHKLMGYRLEFGPDAVTKVLRNLTPCLEEFNSPSVSRWLEGCYAFNSAMRNYHAGKYDQVPRELLKAITFHPQYLFNRGSVAIFGRSILHNVRGFS